jgi:hypothetical protein
VTLCSKKKRGGLGPLGVRLAVALLLLLPALLLAQAAQRNRTLVISGHTGELTVREMDGRSYVEIEALARLTNGSLTFSGNRIVMTLPGIYKRISEGGDRADVSGQRMARHAD